MKSLPVIVLIILNASFMSCSFNSDERNELNSDNTVQEIKMPDFLNHIQPKAKVLLLGTFHFNDAGLDEYKPKYSVDILSEKRQQELDSLLIALERFQPTQIIVERKPDYQEKLDSLYAAYLNGDFELTSNEIYQIGFKMAKRSGLKHLIAGDANAMGMEWNGRDAFDAKIDSIQKKERIKERLLNDYQERFTNMYAYLDSLKTTISLTDYLLIENSDTMLTQKHGHYTLGVIGTNDGIEYPVADALTSWWYNRNIRIFSNIRKTIRNENDRVLVIFGAGHIPIIRHLVSASPEMELVELKDVVMID
jgi:hypothetical protein